MNAGKEREKWNKRLLEWSKRINSARWADYLNDEWYAEKTMRWHEKQAENLERLAICWMYPDAHYSGQTPEAHKLMCRENSSHCTEYAQWHKYALSVIEKKEGGEICPKRTVLTMS
jgi:hypothetical protein